LKNRVTLVTKIPSSEAGLIAVAALLEKVIQLVDLLAKHKFRNEMSKKLKNTRSEALTKFTKSLAVLEETPTPQELAQKRKAERDRVEKERIAKLPAEEQRKYIERERKGSQKSNTPFRHD
jgi:PAT complex subunit CCDC47